MHQSEIQKAQRVIYLVTSYRKDAITESESAELEAWLDLSPENLALFNELNSADQQENALEIMNAYSVKDSFENLKTKIAKEDKLVERKKRYSWIAAAAAILVVISIGGYFYASTKHKNAMLDGLAVAKDVAPGRNKATLTLADGSAVELSGDKQGVVTKANQLTYNDGTEIISKGKFKNQQVTLTTPRGGQYQIVLSDGTKVWLNAASTLKYPAKFEEGERVVQLSGEAYFEVAMQHLSPTKKLPFIVKTETQQVEVLGTHFNINNYPDEAVAKTTLMEGVVVVSAMPTNMETFKLKPNQQSIVTKGKAGIKVIEVNPEATLDWKNGDFIFDADIKMIMRQIGRWYNIDVVYEGKITEEEFAGKVSRSKNLTEVLKVLQETNKVHFKLEDSTVPGVEKRVIVMP